MSVASACRHCLAVVLFALLASSLPAQSWIEPKGEAGVSLTYQYSHFLGHIGPDRVWIPVSPSRSQGLTLQLDYSFSDRLAVSASVPYAGTQNGPDPSPAGGHVGIDDGRYHSAWQDYHFDVRYNLMSRPFVLTPFLTYVVPSHAYTTVGEAAIGRDLRETHIGFNAGRLLNPLLPNAYIDAHIGYVFSQRYLGITTDRTIADVSAGYFVTPRFSARMIVNYQGAHGGLSCGPCFEGPDIPPLLAHQHDRLLADSHVRIGVGTGFSLTPSTDFYAAYVKTVWGQSSHYGHGVALGFSRSFSAARRR